MPTSNLRTRSLGIFLFSSLTASCGAPALDDEIAEDGTTVNGELTAQDRLNACARDPRVIAGLVSQRVCAGADVFFRESFNGNGRTCATCHRVENNFTIDPPFIAALFASNPLDPLFVFRNVPALDTLESNDDLFQKSGILENLDGFEDLANKFAVRSTPHVLSMAITVAPDPAEGRIFPPAEATGWSGDGAPGDGSLRQFLTGAIRQHYPKRLDRVSGVDFRVPTNLELDLTLEFQRSLGRTNELNFQQVRMFDAGAEQGRLAYLDPLRARCNVCHANGGANFVDTGKNRNFDTFTRTAPDLLSFQGVTTDGGFGGQNQPLPNLNTLNTPFPGVTGFGDGTFNTPPVIEAVDSAPFFHNNSFGPDIEGATAFYNSIFRASPSALELDARFNQAVVITGDDIVNIGRFLRVLNAALNLDMAKQRLDAALTLASRFRDTQPGRDIQLQLLRLADAELEDVLHGALNNPPTLPPIAPPTLHPVAQDKTQLARNEVALGLAATSWSQRQSRISAALARIHAARQDLGSNIVYTLGRGNLMF